MFRKKKPKNWFIKIRGSYLPNSWQGWATYVPFVAFLLFVMIYVMNQEYTFNRRLLYIISSMGGSSGSNDLARIPKILKHAVARSAKV